MESIRLKRIVPKLKPLSYKKMVGKAMFFGLIPIEPIMEVVVVPISMYINKLLRKPVDEGWLEFNNGKLIVTANEESQEATYEIKELEGLKIYYSKNLIIEAEVDEGVDLEIGERQLKNGMSRVLFQFEGKEYEYFYEGRRKLVLKLCKQLFESGVMFKEYHDLKRVHLGRQLKYSEIQKLKKNKNVEW